VHCTCAVAGSCCSVSEGARCKISHRMVTMPDLAGMEISHQRMSHRRQARLIQPCTFARRVGLFPDYIVMD
jgi:hypothetical protein